MTASRIRGLACACVSVIAAFCVACPPVSAAAATPGALDPSFGSGGYAMSAYGTWAAAAADVVQPNGYVVTAGQTNVNGTDEIIATRYTSRGQADNGFGNHGMVVVDIGGSAGVDSGAALALQSDGKIVIAGTGAAAGQGDFAVVRLNPNGSLDGTFGHGGVVTIPIGQQAYATAVLVDHAGDIDVAGIARVGGINRFAVARLTSGGALDLTFGLLGITALSPYAAAWGMVLQSDGSLVIAGEQEINSTEAFIAARLQPNGLLDPSFGSGGFVTIPVGSWAQGYAVSLQADGKIVIGGNAKATDGTAIGAVVRLNPNGSLDQGFASGGILRFNGGGLNVMTIDASAHIYVVGVGATVIRLNPDGSTDKSFGHNGFGLYCNGTDCAANGAAIDPTTGKLVLAGITHVGGLPEVLALRVITPLGSGTTGSGPTKARHHRKGSLKLRRDRLISHHGKVTVPLRCASSRRCAGTLAIKHGSARCVRGARFSIEASAKKTLKVSVSGACLTLLRGLGVHALPAQLVASLSSFQPTLSVGVRLSRS